MPVKSKKDRGIVPGKPICPLPIGRHCIDSLVHCLLLSSIFRQERVEIGITWVVEALRQNWKFRLPAD